MSDSVVPRLEELTSQPEVEALLKKLMVNSSSQTFLWVGPEGVGKKTHALALVRTLFCQEGPDCPGCPTCKQVLNRTHPDLFWVDREHFWHDDPKEREKKELTVNVALNVSEKLNRAPLSAPMKIAVIPEADNINDSAQNVLLKTLEEPPAHSLIILIAERLGGFLPTVLSRCRLVRFGVLPNKTVENILVQSQGWAADKARTAAEDAGGNLLLAMRSADENWIQFRQKVQQDLDQALMGKDEDWIRLGSEYDQWEPEFWGEEDLTATQRKTKVHTAALQVYLQLWSRRLTGSVPTPAKLTILPVEQVLRSLQKHQDMIGANLGTRMIMDHLFLELREGLKTGQIDDRSFMELAVQV